MIRIVRWIAVLPGALAGAWLAWFVCNFANRISLLLAGVLPDSFSGRACIETMSSLVLGAAFVYAGSYIAPMYQRQVALALGSLGLFIAVVMVAFAVADLNYWAIWGGIWIAVGIGAVAFTGTIETREPANRAISN
jgi:hypothetical protein